LSHAPDKEKRDNKKGNLKVETSKNQEWEKATLSRPGNQWNCGKELETPLLLNCP